MIHQNWSNAGTHTVPIARPRRPATDRPQRIAGKAKRLWLLTADITAGQTTQQAEPCTYYGDRGSPYMTVRAKSLALRANGQSLGLENVLPTNTCLSAPDTRAGLATDVASRRLAPPSPADSERASLHRLRSNHRPPEIELTPAMSPIEGNHLVRKHSAHAV